MIAKYLKTFTKSQVSAFVGGITDYFIMIFLTEVFGVHYIYSIIAGGIVGAVINYTINRYWAFDARSAPLIGQASKFILVVIGSIFLKSGGTYVLTEFVGIDYKVSRLIADALVAFGWNYLLMQFWVFKKD